MKLVDILARELKVWPEGVSAIEQDLRGSCLYQSRGPAISAYVESMADDAHTAVVTQGQWQAAVDALKAEKVVEWNGEGFPPVGTVCEYRNSLGSWFRVEITAIAKKGICFIQSDRDGENYACQVSSKFRPVRTPEQIAAEEREAELNRMVATVSMLDKGWARKVCAGLYDAGYRKFEIVEKT